MKIKVKRVFRYQVDATTVKVIEPGVHDLPAELAEKVLRFGSAELVVEKKAPKKKARGSAPENKARMAE